MSLDCRKFEYPEGTHTDTRGTCTLHRGRPQPNGRIKLRTYLLWGNGANHHTTILTQQCFMHFLKVSKSPKLLQDIPVNATHINLSNFCGIVWAVFSPKHGKQTRIRCVAIISCILLDSPIFPSITCHSFILVCFFLHWTPFLTNGLLLSSLLSPRSNSPFILSKLFLSLMFLNVFFLHLSFTLC